MGMTEILLIVLVILLVFGASRLPNMARSVGRSMRIFKSEINEMKNDGKETVDHQQIPAAPVQQAPVQQAPVQQPPLQQAPQQPLQYDPNRAAQPQVNTQVNPPADPQQR